MLDNIFPTASTEILEAGKKAMSVGIEAMKSICTIYDEDFRDLVETYEGFASRFLEGKLISA